MSNIGIIRKIDDLGRVVIPKDYRRDMRLSEGDDVKITTEGTRIIIEKYDPITTEYDEVKKYLDILSNEIHNMIVLTGVNRIKISKDFPYIEGDLISEEFSNLAKSHRYYNRSETDPIITCKLAKNSDSLVVIASAPITVNGTDYGALCIVGSRNAISYTKITDKDITLLDYTAKLIADYYSK